MILILPMFEQAHPPYVMAHLHTLLPYLKGDNGLATKQEEAIVCLKLTQMLSMAFLVSKDGDGSDVEQVDGGEESGGGLNLDFEIWHNK